MRLFFLETYCSRPVMSFHERDVRGMSALSVILYGTDMSNPASNVAISIVSSPSGICMSKY